MSRTGTKTVNVTASLARAIDDLLASGAFAVPLSRDEFVRHGITILMVGAADVAAGRPPLARMQDAILAIPGLKSAPPPRPAVPEGLYPSDKLVELMAVESRNHHWKMAIAFEAIRQISEKNGSQGAKAETVIAILAKVDLTVDDVTKAMGNLHNSGRIYRRGEGFAPL